MSARLGSNGTKGFDVNRPLGLAEATAFKAAGYDYVLRYVPRVTPHNLDLTSLERQAIHDARLALMVVQHVEPENWHPKVAKGHSYGTVAALQARASGVAPGTTVWLDLEGVALGSRHKDVIRYCNAWYDAVVSHGYEPGIYVGWHAGLSSDALYRALKFRRYWSAYNLDATDYPAVRGVCMQQSVAQPSDIPLGLGWAPNTIDVNTIQLDQLGGLPTLDFPEVVVA